MDLAGTLINAFVVLGVGAFLTYVVTDRTKKLEAKSEGRFEAIEARLGNIEAAMATKAERDQLAGLADRAQVQRLEERMDLNFNALRADLTRVALAVGAQPRAAEG